MSLLTKRKKKSFESSTLFPGFELLLTKPELYSPFSKYEKEEMQWPKPTHDNFTKSRNLTTNQTNPFYKNVPENKIQETDHEIKHKQTRVLNLI